MNTRAYKMPVQMRYTKEAQSMVNEPDAYSFRKDRGWVWLQKAALWVLEKLGCNHRKAVTNYTTVSIDFSSIERGLMQSYHEIMRRHDREKMTIIMGPNEFDSLRGELSAIPMIQTGILSLPEYRGMKIIVLPWVQGVVMVPDKELHK